MCFLLIEMTIIILNIKLKRLLSISLIFYNQVFLMPNNELLICDQQRYEKRRLVLFRSCADCTFD